MKPIDVLDSRLKIMDKGYDAYEDPDGDLFVQYHKGTFHSQIAITLGNSIYVKQLDEDDSWLTILISKYLDDSGKEMTVFVE